MSQTSHRTLKEVGHAFLLLRSGAGCGMLRRLDAFWHPITGAALHRGVFGGTHLLRFCRSYNLGWLKRAEKKSVPLRGLKTFFKIAFISELDEKIHHSHV